MLTQLRVSRPFRPRAQEKFLSDNESLSLHRRALDGVPYRKVGQLRDLGENEVVELFSLVVRAQELLRQVTKAQGFNIGINVGECAGAGVPDHLHIHIVPRWSGDTNFMPMLSGTRVLSQGLNDLYQKLKAAQTASDEAR